MTRRDEVERIIREGFADMTTPSSAVTDERLAEITSERSDPTSAEILLIARELAALRAPATEWQGMESAISLIERAQLNTPELYSSWHDDARKFLAALGEAP